ncbi:MAG: copper oxidase [Chloroflexi bacterium]|nr:MAG: copper oxidase [Chloroflexota bacterium]
MDGMDHGLGDRKPKGAGSAREKAAERDEGAFGVTRAQLVAVSLLSMVALAAGVLFSAATVNLALGARDVGGAVMPPMMTMTRDTPGQAMRDMAAIDPRTVSYRAPVDARGDQPLEARIDNGVKVYDFTISVIEWNILPYERVMAYAVNGQVPGPRIRVTEGDRVRFNVTNRLPESTTIHWHGLVVPNAMDGPAGITQAPIAPGASFTYEFTVQQAGTFFYHSHDHADRQQALGLYGALIIDPRDPSTEPRADLEVVIQLQEWLEKEGYTFPAMPMDGAQPNFFTINGKAFPSTQTVRAKVGDRIRVRFIGTNSGFIHPMHIHGGPFTIVATDGVPMPASAQIQKDTVNVGPGERYDVIWTAREPGKWLLHCHINHHTTNDNVEEQGGGGLTMIIEVSS